MVYINVPAWHLRDPKFTLVLSSSVAIHIKGSEHNFVFF